jgi:peroxiredoxin
MDTRRIPGWPRTLLLLAGTYQLLVGLLLLLAPARFLAVLGLADVSPTPWQLFGVLTLSLGGGLLAAAVDWTSAWPLALAGLLAKLLGPLVVLPALLASEVPAALGWGLLIDTLWMLPLGAVLVRSVRAILQEEAIDPPEELTTALANAVTQDGQSLLAMSRETPLLVVFLRHFGCNFCREAVADAVTHRSEIEASSAQLVFVHLSDDAERAKQFFTRYHAADVPRVADPAGRLYRAARLGRMSPLAMFRLDIWRRVGQAAREGGHTIGIPDGDVFRLGGVFLIHDGQVVREHRLADASTKPDYCGLAACPVGADA